MASKYIGIDIGTSIIKLADITVGKKSTIIGAFTTVNTPRFLVHNGRISDSQELINLLKDAISKRRFKHKKAVVILNDSIVITREMEMPAAKHKELEKMVKLEASEYHPNDIDEYTVRYKILSQGKKNTGNINMVIMSSVKNDLVLDFYDVFRKVGLKPVAIDSTLNCMIKYLNQHFKAVNEKSGTHKTIALLDMGARNIKLVIFREGFPEYSQIFNHGSQKIDVLIANVLNIEREEAEEHKVEYGLSYLTNIARDELSREVGMIISTQIDIVLKDIYKHIQSFNSGNLSDPITEILLTGGMSRMKGLCRVMTESFAIACTVVQKNNFMGFSLEDKIEFAGTHKIEDDYPLYTNLIGAASRED